MDMKNHTHGAVLLSSLLLAATIPTAMAQSLTDNVRTGTIIQSVDDNGTVTFSDQPTDDPDAVIVETQQINVSDPVPAAADANDNAARNAVTADAIAGAPDTAEEAAPTVDIELVSIASPLPDATVMIRPEPLLVNVETSPASLEESGLIAEVHVDGVLAASGTESSLPIMFPDRGTHTLQVLLIDEDGQRQAASEIQEVHIQQGFVGKGS